MSRFFAVGAILCTLMLLCSLILGHFGAFFGFSTSHHLLFGMATALVAVSIHCLIFAIFTGSGKDTRLMTEDLNLDPEVYKRMKGFKRTVFPPALYSIFFIILTIAMGGLYSVLQQPALTVVHMILAWGTVYYNLKSFVIEYRAIVENAELIEKINSLAASKVAEQGATKLEVDQLPSDIEWGTHVYALGKFLCFLAWNTWIPYVYFRYIMAMVRTPLWPFLSFSLILLGCGYYLRLRYYDFRPDRQRS